MNAPLPVMRSSFEKVGRGLSVRFTLIEGAIEAEWRPRHPTPADRKVLPRYRAARDRFLSTLAARTGVGVAVLEVL